MKTALKNTEAFAKRVINDQMTGSDAAKLSLTTAGFSALTILIILICNK